MAFSSPYLSQFQSASASTGVPLSILEAVTTQEDASQNPNAIGSSGEIGLMQIMPGNFASLGISNPNDPGQNILGGATLLEQLYAATGNWTTALEEYNGGPNGPYESGPQSYAASVLGMATSFGLGGSTNAAATTVTPAGTGTASTWLAGLETWLANVAGSGIWVVIGIILVIAALWAFVSDSKEAQQIRTTILGSAGKAPIGEAIGAAALA